MYFCWRATPPACGRPLPVRPTPSGVASISLWSHAIISKRRTATAIEKSSANPLNFAPLGRIIFKSSFHSIGSSTALRVYLNLHHSLNQYPIADYPWKVLWHRSVAQRSHVVHVLVDRVEGIHNVQCNHCAIFLSLLSHFTANIFIVFKSTNESESKFNDTRYIQSKLNERFPFCHLSTYRTKENPLNYNWYTADVIDMRCRVLLCTSHMEYILCENSIGKHRNAISLPLLFTNSFGWNRCLRRHSLFVVSFVLSHSLRQSTTHIMSRDRFRVHCFKCIEWRSRSEIRNRLSLKRIFWISS